MSPDTTDLCEAASLIEAVSQHESIPAQSAIATRRGQHWCQRAIARLEQRLEAGLNPHPMPTSEQQCMAILKDAANELQMAGTALGQAAQALKFAGKGLQATHTKQAATRALQAAQGLGG